MLQDKVTGHSEVLAEEAVDLANEVTVIYPRARTPLLHDVFELPVSEEPPAPAFDTSYQGRSPLPARDGAALGDGASRKEHQGEPQGGAGDENERPALPGQHEEAPGSGPLRLHTPYCHQLLNSSSPERPRTGAARLPLSAAQQALASAFRERAPRPGSPEAPQEPPQEPPDSRPGTAGGSEGEGATPGEREALANSRSGPYCQRTFDPSKPLGEAAHAAGLPPRPMTAAQQSLASAFRRREALRPPTPPEGGAGPGSEPPTGRGSEGASREARKKSRSKAPRVDYEDLGKVAQEAEEEEERQRRRSGSPEEASRRRPPAEQPEEALLASKHDGPSAGPGGEERAPAEVPEKPSEVVAPQPRQARLRRGDLKPIKNKAPPVGLDENEDGLLPEPTGAKKLVLPHPPKAARPKAVVPPNEDAPDAPGMGDAVATMAATATRIQAAWRGFLVRRALRRQLSQAAALEIQAVCRCALARRTLRLRMVAAVAPKIKAACRSALARHTLRCYADSFATQIQTAWRGFVGWRLAMRRRVDRANGLIESLGGGKTAAPAKSFTYGKSNVWLDKALGALDWLGRAEREADEQQQRSAHALRAAKLGTSALSNRAAMERKVYQLSDCWITLGVLDRNTAAAAVHRGRVELRTRAMLLAAVQGKVAAFSLTGLSTALKFDETLLSRLSVEVALAEVAQLASAAWVAAVACGPDRPDAVPQPQVLLGVSLVAMCRRLRAELLPSSSGVTPQRGPQDERQARAVDVFLSEEAAAARVAEQRARHFADAKAAALREEATAARAEGKKALQVTTKAVSRVADAVSALKEKSKRAAAEAENALRKEREEKHAQTTCLFEFSLAAQTEKERLESALASRRGVKIVVVERVGANVKRLQKQLADLEVRGVSNRKSQGILAHTLKALEARVVQAEKDSSRASEKDMTEDWSFKPSRQIMEKQEHLVEQKQKFREALDTELENLRSNMEAAAVREVASVGAKFREEAEVCGEAVVRALRRLADSQEKAHASREWLGELPVLARTRATTMAVAAHARAACNQDFARFTVAVLQSFEALRGILRKVEAVEAAPEGNMAHLASQLRGVQQAVARLRAEYPDPAPAKPPAVAAQEVQPTVQLNGKLQERAAAWAAPPAARAAPEPAVEPVLVKPAPAAPAPEAAAPDLSSIFTNATAGLSSLGVELTALSDTLASGPQRRRRPGRQSDAAEPVEDSQELPRAGMATSTEPWHVARPTTAGPVRPRQRAPVKPAGAADPPPEAQLPAPPPPVHGGLVGASVTVQPERPSTQQNGRRQGRASPPPELAPEFASLMAPSSPSSPVRIEAPAWHPSAVNGPFDGERAFKQVTPPPLGHHATPPVTGRQTTPPPQVGRMPPSRLATAGLACAKTLAEPAPPRRGSQSNPQSRLLQDLLLK